MNKIIISLAILCLSHVALADQTSIITCIGKNVTLTTKTPYWGENSDSAQTLYVLKSTNHDIQDESIATAYFLDVDAETDVDSHGMIHTVGVNCKGGKFNLRTKFWQEESDGTVVNKKATGLLSYEHGYLNGKDEAVTCVKN